MIKKPEYRPKSKYDWPTPPMEDEMFDNKVDPKPPQPEPPDPVEPPQPVEGFKRGRTSKTSLPTDPVKLSKLRYEVSILAGGNVPPTKIADYIGIGVGDLKKNFQHELGPGGVKRQCDLIIASYESGFKGVITSAKFYLSLTEDTEHKSSKKVEPAMPKPIKLGKKEQARRNANNPDIGTPLGELMAQREKSLNGTTVELKSN